MLESRPSCLWQNDSGGKCNEQRQHIVARATNRGWHSDCVRGYTPQHTQSMFHSGFHSLNSMQVHQAEPSRAGRYRGRGRSP